MEPILVVAAIIPEEDTYGKIRYLMTQRPYNKKQNAGEWEFLGGRKKDDESPRKALERKLFEELGIVVKAEGFFSTSSHTYENGLQVDIRAFNCRHVAFNIKMVEIIDYDWIRPENMHVYNISKPDLAFVEKLKTLSQ